MSPLRILIVDDEPLARERLRALLRHEAEAEIVGESGTAPEAIEAIRTLAPDLVFLDMQMPGGDGLQVVEALPADRRPAIVFVTAHEKFAVDAFEVQAVDYLLKPFDRQRFKVALQRVRDKLQSLRAAGSGARADAQLSDAATARRAGRLAVKVDGRIVMVKTEDIVWVEAADNYVLLHLTAGRVMLRETLSSVEERLGPQDFVRVNRSALVHLDRVKELQPTPHGDYTVVLLDGTRLSLSRSLRGQLERLTGDRLG